MPPASKSCWSPDDGTRLPCRSRKQLGFDLWLISSNGAVTRSLAGETFHRDLMPAATCRQLCGAMQEFRGNTVLTFDKETKGAIVLEHLDELGASIRRWLEKNMEYIEFVIPIENALVSDPVQAMFCGTMARMSHALQRTRMAREWTDRVTVLRTEYPERDLSMIDVLNAGCSKGHALERWAAHRGYRREEVMAIGDNHNDVEMLEFAGHPVIMGNACEELRARGWTVTRGNDACGVAAAVELALGAETLRRCSKTGRSSLVVLQMRWLRFHFDDCILLVALLALAALPCFAGEVAVLRMDSRSGMSGAKSSAMLPGFM